MKLMKQDAKTDVKAITIRGASMLPSGDVPFYTENKAQQRWLMDHKHVWSKEVHIDLELSPSTYLVMIHVIPGSFDIGKPANLAQLASENNFQASDMVCFRWLGPPSLQNWLALSSSLSPGYPC